MELTIDQALQKGIEAHKLGQVQDADRYYTSILKAQPKHPDANHNMGVLAVDVGKVETALPFFKTALEANPSMSQFWLSYIDALIKLCRLEDAKVGFDQAKSMGAKGDRFDQLKQQITVASQESSADGTFIETLEANHSRNLFKATHLRETGKFNDAIDLLKDEITRSTEDADMLALISHCHLLADQVEEAKLYLNKAKEFAPENASVRWNTIRLKLKEKKPIEALNFARDTSERFPDDVEGMGVLGACLRANGEMVESLNVLNRAIELNPDYAEALINRGLIRLSQENKSEALSDLEQAHRLKPHMKQIWDLVVRLKLEAQEYSDLIILLIKMIEIDPANEKCFSLIAALNQKVGDSALAVKSFQKVLEVRPGSATTHLNLGIALTKRGETKMAIANFKKALAIKSDYAEAYFHMGNLLVEQDKLEEAIEAYAETIAIKPDSVEAFNNMGQTLKGVRFSKANQHVEAAIISILDRKTIARPKNICHAALSLVKCQPQLKDLGSSLLSIKSEHKFAEIIEQLSRTPLLLKLMSVCPLPDLGVERLLCGLRSYIVKNIADITVTSSLLKLQSALALQCFTNEYVYDFYDGDAEALHKLEDSASNTLANGSQPNPHIILCLASFKALHMYEWSDHLRSNGDLEDVIRSQIVEPNEEKILKSEISVLDEITDEVSIKVREQYEENPYPRWVSLGLRLNPASIAQVSKEIELKLSNKEVLSVSAPEILIAGCGTGQHSISTAARFKNSKVLAIDLSSSSLAYAKRKTKELGIHNIDYMQADILKLRSLDSQFDIIESAGVLHHMDDPIAGWEVLVDCLRPGGLMRVGLYSELARQPVVDFRGRIAQTGLITTEDNIRALRTTIAKSEDNSSKLVRSWQDYFSMSELRDLLFHVQEHRFTLPEIKDCLSQLGLEFCGFEAKNVVKAFKVSNTTKGAEYDLDKWHTFEQVIPRVFTGMYQFWCQKIG